MKTHMICMALFAAAMAVWAEGEFGLAAIRGSDTARLTAFCDDDASPMPSFSIAAAGYDESYPGRRKDQ